MNRRDFLKSGTFAVAAAALGTIPLNKIYPCTKSHFSLEIIAGDADRAITLTEKLINSCQLGSRTIRFSEYKLGKPENGDIVLFRNSQLVNYKRGNDEINSGLREIASALALPAVIEDPVRLRFYTDCEAVIAKRFLVFYDGILVNSINASAENLDLKIDGFKGGLMLNVCGRRARVIQSACSHKNCVNSGSITFANESLVCIPNKITIVAD